MRDVRECSVRYARASHTLLTLSRVYCIDEVCSWNDDWKMRQNRRSVQHGIASRSRRNLLAQFTIKSPLESSTHTGTATGVIRDTGVQLHVHCT